MVLRASMSCGVTPEICPVSKSLFNPLCFNGLMLDAIVTYVVTGVNGDRVILETTTAFRRADERRLKRIGKFLDFSVSKAICCMVVHHTHRLHECVADC